MNRKIDYFDVVVVGAGPAGIAAAVTCAEKGLKTALIERLGTVGGNLTLGNVAPFMGEVCQGTITERIERALGAEKTRTCEFSTARRVLLGMLLDAGVRVYLQTGVSAAVTEGMKIHAIVSDEKYGGREFRASFFIDCTGDGDLCTLAGCDFFMGRESDGLVQPVSLLYVIGGVSLQCRLTCCHEEDFHVLEDGREYIAMCREACRSGELPPSVNIVRLYDNGNPGERIVNATQVNRVDPLDPLAAARAQYELLEQIETVNRFLRNNVLGFKNITIKSVSSILGVRESRRIRGDYVLTGSDVISGRKFNDAAVHNALFCIDIHNPDGAGQAENDGCPVTAKPYDIPYRCFIPAGYRNLFTAGRCISGDHRAHASYRVMRICMAMGQAVGIAAALCAKRGCESRELDTSALREALMADGVQLEER